MTQIIKNISSQGGVGAFEFSAPPTITDDFNSGFLNGDRWLDTLEKKEYALLDGTAGAAVWKKTTEETDENGNIVIESGIVYGSTLTPPVITGNIDNYSPSGVETTVLLRLSTSGNYSITGLQHPTPASAQEIKIFNVGSSNITFKNNDSGSSADFRFLLGGNKTLQPSEGLSLIYDPTSLRWRGTGILI